MYNCIKHEDFSCYMYTVNVEIFDRCLISFFSSLDSTHEIKLISHTYVNITDENLCARNLRIVGLVQKVRNFDASKISTFTVCVLYHDDPLPTVS